MLASIQMARDALLDVRSCALNLEALYGGQLAEARRNILQLREQVETREECVAKSSRENATLIRRLAAFEKNVPDNTVADASVQIDLPPSWQP